MRVYRKWAWYLGGAKIELRRPCSVRHKRIWHAGSCVQLLRSTLLLLSHNLDFQSVNRLPKSIRSCVLCCHALNKLDSSANEIYGILKASGPYIASSLRLERYSPWPFGLLNPVHSMASTSIYRSQFAYTSITESSCCTNGRFLRKLKERAPSSTVEENLQQTSIAQVY